MNDRLVSAFAPVILALFFIAIVWSIIVGGWAIYDHHHQPVKEKTCRNEFGQRKDCPEIITIEESDHERNR